MDVFGHFLMDLNNLCGVGYIKWMCTTAFGAPKASLWIHVSFNIKYLVIGLVVEVTIQL
jgi:hypothetical protein